MKYHIRNVAYLKKILEIKRMMRTIWLMVWISYLQPNYSGQKLSGHTSPNNTLNRPGPFTLIQKKVVKF